MPPLSLSLPVCPTSGRYQLMGWLEMAAFTLFTSRDRSASALPGQACELL